MAVKAAMTILTIACLVLGIAPRRLNVPDQRHHMTSFRVP
jgi:hypothetical protein